MPKVIPFGDRMLVKRRKVGEKAGSIFLPDEAKERPTDLADVIFIPEHSFADIKLIENSEQIIGSLVKKAANGNSDALVALLTFNSFLKIKSIKVGDAVMISKYVGTTFHETGSNEELTLVKGEDIIGLITKDE